MADSSDDFIRRLRERRLFQVLILYVGVAWGLAQVAEFFVDNYDLSRRILDLSLFLLVVGLPVAAVLAWFHGEKGLQRVQRTEAGLLAGLLAVAAVGTYLIGTAEPVESRALDAVVDLGSHSVAVMPFDVAHPELEWLREGAAELLTTGLAGHAGIRVVSGQRLFDLLRQEGREGAGDVPQGMASRLARRAGARYLVDGSVLGDPGDLVIRADLVDVESGDVRASSRVRGSDVFELVDGLVADLAAQVAGATTGADELPSVASVTTRSPEAYREYLLGLLAERRFHPPEALEHYEAAVALDTTFALAWMRLGGLAMDVGNISRAVEALRLAREYRDSAPARDRLFLDAMLAEAVAGDEEHARRLLDSLVRLYPDDKEARAALVRLHPGNSPERARLLEETIRLDPLDASAFNSLAYYRAGQGDFAAAESLIRRYVELEPTEPNPLDSRGEILMMADRHEEAREAFRRALELRPDFEPALRHLAESWAAEERYAEGGAELRSIIERSEPPARAVAYPGLATLLVAEGRLEEAVEALRAAVATAEATGQRAGAGVALASQLPILFALQDWDGVREASDALASTDPLNPFPPYTRFLAAAERGDVGRAVSVADSMQAVMRTTPGLGEFRGLVEAVSSRDLSYYGGSHESTLEWDERVRERGGWPEIGGYVVPRALLALGRHEEASTRARRLGSFSGPAQELVEHVGLYYDARGREGAGDVRGARETYEELLRGAWRETARRVPLISDAPARLAALGGSG